LKYRIHVEEGHLGPRHPTLPARYRRGAPAPATRASVGRTSTSWRGCRPCPREASWSTSFSTGRGDPDGRGLPRPQLGGRRHDQADQPLVLGSRAGRAAFDRGELHHGRGEVRQRRDPIFMLAKDGRQAPTGQGGPVRRRLPAVPPARWSSSNSSIGNPWRRSPIPGIWELMWLGHVR
jgi:hypothetical protein